MRPSDFRFSLASVLAAVTVCGVGLALMRVTPALSMFNLIAVFLVGASPGVLIGYAVNKWPGSVKGGIVSGGILIAFLIVLIQILF